MFLTKYCVSHHYISYLNSKQYITNRLLFAVWEEDRPMLLSLFTFAFFVVLILWWLILKFCVMLQQDIESLSVQKI